MQSTAAAILRTAASVLETGLPARSAAIEKSSAAASIESGLNSTIDSCARPSTEREVTTIFASVPSRHGPSASRTGAKQPSAPSSTRRSPLRRPIVSTSHRGSRAALAERPVRPRFVAIALASPSRSAT
jgi:hypothetical protein